jgi:hypothetical protein
MKIEKIVLESLNNEHNKYMIEISLFRYSNIQILSDDISIFNSLFSSLQ